MKVQISKEKLLHAGASGARKRVAATLAEDARSWAILLPWFEPGSHAVSVSVNGARVGSGAFEIPHTCSYDRVMVCSQEV